MQAATTGQATAIESSETRNDCINELLKMQHEAFSETKRHPAGCRKYLTARKKQISLMREIARLAGITKRGIRNLDWWNQTIDWIEKYEKTKGGK